MISTLGWVTVNLSFQIYDKQIFDELADKFHLYSRSLEDHLRKIDDLSVTIFSDTQIQENLRKLNAGSGSYESSIASKDLQERLMAFIITQRYIESIEVLDSFGNKYGTGFHRMNMENEQINEIKRKAETGSGANIWIVPQQNDRTIISARVIREATSLNLQTLGTLIIRVNLQNLVSSMVRPIGSYDSELLILDQGRVVYPFETVYDPTGLQVIQDKKGYYIDNIEGKKALVAYSAFDYTGWTFVHIVPFDKIFERISWMKLIMIALYAAIFVAAIYLGTQFSKSITSPIENLTSRMKVVEKGIFEPDDIPQFKHHDEISRLSRDFEKMIDKIHILVQENYLKQLVIKETEYKALQSKINPHFLYNTLESINWVAIVNGQDHISRMVKSLGDLLRNSIGAQEYVTVKEELDMLDNYLFIQTFRYEERLSVTLNIEERFLDYTIPKLIIQPIVENAIHYGVEGLTGTCRIIITAGVDRNLFFLQVSDTGQGMENDYLEQMETGNVKPKGTGMGLKNIDERLKLIYGNDYGVRIESSDQGTSVLILMPILAAKEMQHVQSDVS